MHCEVEWSEVFSVKSGVRWYQDGCLQKPCSMQPKRKQEIKLQSGNLEIVFHVFVVKQLSTTTKSQMFWKACHSRDWKQVLYEPTVMFLHSCNCWDAFHIDVLETTKLQPRVIMTEFLGKWGLNQQDMDGSCTKVQKYKSTKVQKCKMKSWNSRTREAADNAVKSGSNAPWDECLGGWADMVGGRREGSF